MARGPAGSDRDHLAGLSHRHLGDGRDDRDRPGCAGGDPVVVAAELAVLRSPKLFSLALRERQRRKGFEAISRGLIAIGAGDARAARAMPANAESSLPNEPLDAAAAGADRAAQRRPRRRRARLPRDGGARRHPAARPAWALSSRRSAATIRSRRGCSPSRPRRRRRRSPGRARRCWNSAAPPATGTARSTVLERNTQERPDRSRRRGGGSAPCCSPRARSRSRTRIATCARRSRSRRPSSRPTWCRPRRSPAGCSPRPANGARPASIVEAAWKINPHPDLADAYAHLRLGRFGARPAGAGADAGAHGARPCRRRARGRRARRSMRSEFATARAALEPLAAAPTQRVAMLMAELEEPEHGDEGRAREWMTRALTAARDPAWIADGFVSDRWLPVSPVTGRLDAFEWKVPVAEIGERRADRGAAGARRSRGRPAAGPPEAVRGPLAAARQCDAGDQHQRCPRRRPSRRPDQARAAPGRADHSADPGARRPRPGTRDGRADGTPASSWQRIRQIFR